MDALRIFIVDDDRDFAQSLALLMKRRGHEAEVAFSGEEAIEKFHQQNAGEEQPFDITFMDVMLTGKNGVESFMEIRKLRPEARVVMMTGFSVKQLLEQAVEHGVWRVLDKPIDIPKMLGILDDIKPDGILIVDDDVDFVASIKHLLMSHGYTVFVARNGREAIERIHANGVDILILDLRMPILGGLETYLELKKTGHLVPTIIITAYADEDIETIAELESLAIGGILRKPFDPRELLDAVDHLSPARIQ
jgi:CheY-like chemotaxis protein